MIITCTKIWNLFEDLHSIVCIFNNILGVPTHLKSLEIIVPKRFCHSQFLEFPPLSACLVENQWFLEKLKIIVLLLIFIFWCCVHEYNSFKNCWDLRFSGGIHMLFSSISEGSWLFRLNEDNPMVKRLIISQIDKSSINLNPSSILTQSDYY